MKVKPIINSIKVIPFIVALTVGSIETSKLPSIPWGLGPRIRKATAALTAMDTT